MRHVGQIITACRIQYSKKYVRLKGFLQPADKALRLNEFASCCRFMMNEKLASYIRPFHHLYRCGRQLYMNILLFSMKDRRLCKSFRSRDNIWTYSCPLALVLWRR